MMVSPAATVTKTGGETGFRAASSALQQRPAMISGARNSSQLALFAKIDPLDYYREEGFTVSFSTKLFDFTQFRLQYNDVDQSSAPKVTDYSFFDRDKQQRTNPAIVDGRLRSVSASFTYDSRPLLKRKGRDFYFNNLTYTRIMASAE